MAGITFYDSFEEMMEDLGRAMKVSGHSVSKEVKYCFYELNGFPAF